MTKGQTLIGVLIATFTLMILVVGIVGVAVVTTRILFEAERTVVALGIVNQEIELLRSMPYSDVGQVVFADWRDAGVVQAPDLSGEFVMRRKNETIERNDQSFDMETDAWVFEGTVTEAGKGYKPWKEIGLFNDIVYATGIFGGENQDDFIRIVVKVRWTTAAGVEREVKEITYISEKMKPLRCGECPEGRMACDLSTGFCPWDRHTVPIFAGYEADCIPGLLCDNGLLCPISRSCADAVTPPEMPEGDACVPGTFCADGALCLLSGVCPVKACSQGTCGGDGVCFSGFCYDEEWYKLSFAYHDTTGPGGVDVPEMMCQKNCTDTNDCSTPCRTSDGDYIVWQCEPMWRQYCSMDGRQANTISPACSGTYNEEDECVGDGAFECEPEPCMGDPGDVDNIRLYCEVSGQECYQSSSLITCGTHRDCPPGEMCYRGSASDPNFALNRNKCRTICPKRVSEGGSIQCRNFYGGYGKGCRPYKLSGVAASVRSCASPGGSGFTPMLFDVPDVVPRIYVNLTSNESGAFFEGEDGGKHFEFKVRLEKSNGDLLDEEDIKDTVAVRVEPVSLDTDGNDYTGGSETIYFNPGDDRERVVNMQITEDHVPEIHETFRETITAARSNAHDVRIRNAASEGIEVIIVNDDWTVEILDSPDVPEGKDTGEYQASFEMIRRGSTIGVPGVLDDKTVRVMSKLNKLDAEPPDDYIDDGNHQITWDPSPDLEEVKVRLVDIVGDDVYEQNEDFESEIQLIGSPGVVVVRSTATATILDDDFMVDLFLAGLPVYNEGDGGSRVVQLTLALRDGRVAPSPIRVGIYTEEETAIVGEDFNRLGIEPVTITVPTGLPTQDFTVQVVPDAIFEEPRDETFLVKIEDGSVVGATQGISEARATIHDDDGENHDPCTENSDCAVSEGYCCVTGSTCGYPSTCHPTGTTHEGACMP